MLQRKVCKKNPNPDHNRRSSEIKENLRELLEMLSVMDVADFMSAVASFHND